MNFNLVNTATNISNLSSINKNNRNDCGITKAYEEKAVEAVLASSVLVSTPDKVANLRLVENIDSTIDQFETLIEKARKFTIDNDFTVKNRAHSSTNQKTKLKKLTHGGKTPL